MTDSFFPLYSKSSRQSSNDNGEVMSAKMFVVKAISEERVRSPPKLTMHTTDDATKRAKKIHVRSFTAIIS